MRALSSTRPARAASSAPVVRSMSLNGSRSERRSSTMKPSTTLRALSGTMRIERPLISGRRSRFSNCSEIRSPDSSLSRPMSTGSPVTMHWKNGVWSGKASASPTGTVSSQRPGSSLCSTHTRCQTVVASGAPSGKPSPASTWARRWVPAKSANRGTAALVTSRMVRARSSEVPMRPDTSLRNSRRSRTAACSRSSASCGSGGAAPWARTAPPAPCVGATRSAAPPPPRVSRARRSRYRGTPQSGVTGTRSHWLISRTG